MANSKNDEESTPRDTVKSKQLGIRREFVHANLVRAHVPTIPYEALDPAGHIQPWSLLKILDSGDMETAWFSGEIQPTYLLQIDMTIDAGLYDLDSPKYPLVMDYTNSYVNKSSRGSITTLYHPSMPKPYAIQKCLNVNVDPVTKRPSPYPSWWREKHKFPTSDVKQKLTELHVPEDGKYMTNHRTVHFSDIDENNHMNYAVYVRFCYESLFENLLADKRCYEADCMLVGNTKEIHVNYKQECLLGDVLAIRSWKDNVSSDTFHFAMLKKNESVANLTMVFYKSKMQSSQHSKL